MTEKLLVVDDLAHNRYLLRSLLERHGFQVIEAEDGAQAIAIARREVPDALITDLLMPQMDGFELCREWVRDDRLKYAPVIVYTATYTNDEDRQFVLDLGAAAFIIKPAEPSALVEQIRLVLARNHPRTPAAPASGDASFHARYSARLQHKLQDKVEQLAHTEKALRQYVRRCEAIFDLAPEGIVCLGSELTIQCLSFGAERMLGRTEAEAAGTSLDTLFAADDMGLARAQLTLARAHEQRTWFEARALRQGGGTVECAVTLTWLGDDVGFVVLLEDLADARQAAAEKQKLEEQLATAQRMEALGRLVGGVAHDFNNYLSVIIGHAEMLTDDLPPSSQAAEDAQRIREASERAVGLVKQLLAFSRLRPAAVCVLNPGEVVSKMEPMLRRLIGEHVELRVETSADAGSIEIDPSQLEQVVLNLVVNARDAMPYGGVVTVAVACAGGQVTLAVTDTGGGMDEATQAHVFDPFFTTKAPGAGTGIGLATVRAVVERHGGSISLTSAPGRGARFQAQFPRVGARTEPAPNDSGATASHRGRGELILVVEDDAIVRALTERILKRAGYRVLSAAHANAAAGLLAGFAGPVDLSLIDVVLPRVGGPTLAEDLAAAQSTRLVLFTSGYPREDLVQQRGLPAGAPLIQKPFSAAELCGAVRAVLDGEPPPPSDRA